MTPAPIPFTACEEGGRGVENEEVNFEKAFNWSLFLISHLIFPWLNLFYLSW